MADIKEYRKNGKHFWLWILSTLLLFTPLFIAWQYREMLPLGIAYVGRENLSGTVVENYPGNPPATGITVKIDGEWIKLSKPGSFIAENLTLGRHLVTIEGPSYATLSEDIEIKRGKNESKFKLLLTPVEAANRWMQTKKEDKHAETYSFFHPDDKKRIDPAGYVKFKTDIKNRFGVTIKSYKVDSPRVFMSWEHPRTKRVYRNVIAMKASAVLEAPQVGSTETAWTIYAQNLNGRWVFFSTE
ncbi:MAG: hypothetical protein K6T91_08305 [Firmicutes bacterium]|nr:hypothetical protein [Bacillota bacterium]